jgi:iron(III) transport system substrate-binding protein
MKLSGFLRVILISGCLLAAGCKKSAQTHILVYTALEPEEYSKLQPEFEAAHPDIKLDIFPESTGIVTSKLLAESANPQADVVWGLAATSLLVADQKGLLEPYAPAGVAQISPQFKDSKPVPHWVGIDGFMTAFAVNTAELAKANLPVPKGYLDLIKPEYKGLITMPKPNTSGTGFLCVSGILQIMGENAGWVYLQQLDQNIAKYTSSGSEPAQSAGTGEHPIGISFDFRVLQEVAKGGPLTIVFPVEKSGWEMEANALVKKPNINPAAKVFLDWAISQTAFKFYSANFGIVANPAYMNPPPGFPAHPTEQMIPNNFPWAAANRERILAEWTRRFGGKSGST